MTTTKQIEQEKQNQSPIQINEQIEDWCSGDLLIDRENHLIRNIALTGMKSRNGYQYSEQSLRDALGLYENRPVFLDHASNLAKPYDRSTRDLVGSVVNPRFEKNRVRGDIRILETEAGRTFLALVESNTPSVGMSQVVMGERGKDSSKIEKIHDVISVDAVIFPATTTTFREQQEPYSSSQKEKSKEVVQERILQLEEELETFRKRNKELLLKISELEQRERKTGIQNWIREQNIPEHILSETFLEQLEAAGSDEERTELLDDRLSVCERMTRHSPISHERFSSQPDDLLCDDSIISIIKCA